MKCYIEILGQKYQVRRREEEREVNYKGKWISILEFTAVIPTDQLLELVKLGLDEMGL